VEPDLRGGHRLHDPDSGVLRVRPEAVHPGLRRRAEELSAEGQRQADGGDGTYLNPILAGDYPDPTVLADGDDYYLTYSSFEASPGLQLWHSRDLVNWTPIGPALNRPIATVFAVDLVKHKGRYYIYIPFIPAPWAPEFGDAARICVISASSITGPWSEPVDLGITGYIDPGHAVGEDGKRYLFLSGVSRVQAHR
jgi:xylan 1,4-beta-xylosidase